MTEAHEEAAVPVDGDEVVEPEVGTPLTRRELLSYVWVGSMGVFAAQLGAATILFSLPRFKAGEFGGVFPIGDAGALPDFDADPLAVNEGKFWLVNTPEGLLALYRVCTHLGCLYAWQASDNKFICPCHGSQFQRGGQYIQGPAPRSLDAFNVIVTDAAGNPVTSTRDVTPTGVPYAPVPVEPGQQLIVDTGDLINAGSRQAGFEG